jgi:hypothetical protein
MNRPEEATEPVCVACEVCLKEIPHEQASIEEVDDYVMYFCGLDCYQAWRENNPKQRSPDEA